MDVWIERRLASKRYDLRGTPDRVDVSIDKSVRITDYKFGNISSFEGQIEQGYVLQLLAYALLVEERVPQARIELRLIGKDRAWHFDFDTRAHTQITGLLGRLARDLPRGHRVTARSTAAVGDHCRTCGYRPSCARYLEASPANWPTQTSLGRRFDRWGTLLKVSGHGPLKELRVRDATGRVIAVRGVPDAALRPTHQVGSLIWLFDLAAVGTTGTATPVNFKILDPNHVQRSAHTALVL